MVYMYMLPPQMSTLSSYAQMTKDRCTRCDERRDPVTKSSCKRRDAC